VVSFRPRWVIQLGESVAIQARIPVAAAPAVIALAMHCSEKRIEEAIQTACDRFVDKAGGISVPGQVYTWLRTTAHRVLSRDEEHHLRELPVDPTHESLRDLAAEDPGPVEEAIAYMKDGRRRGDDRGGRLERIRRLADSRMRWMPSSTSRGLNTRPLSSVIARSDSKSKRGKFSSRLPS
jgi:hypothetical protein